MIPSLWQTQEHTLSQSWQRELVRVLDLFHILLIQLLHSLCTTFLWSSYDLVMWHHLTVTCNHVTLWLLVTWYFLMLYPCVVSLKKKRNINNDLVILPSHDTILIIIFPIWPPIQFLCHKPPWEFSSLKYSSIFFVFLSPYILSILLIL